MFFYKFFRKLGHQHNTTMYFKETGVHPMLAYMVSEVKKEIKWVKTGGSKNQNL